MTLVSTVGTGALMKAAIISSWEVGAIFEGGAGVSAQRALVLVLAGPLAVPALAPEISGRALAVRSQFIGRNAALCVS